MYSLYSTSYQPCEAPRQDNLSVFNSHTLIDRFFHIHYCTYFKSISSTLSQGFTGKNPATCGLNEFAFFMIFYQHLQIRDTRTSTQSRRLVRRKGASWSLNWPSGANSLAHLQLKCILYVPL